jgi:hypothetical protein
LPLFSSLLLLLLLLLLFRALAGPKSSRLLLRHCPTD